MSKICASVFSGLEETLFDEVFFRVHAIDLVLWNNKTKGFPRFDEVEYVRKEFDHDDLHRFVMENRQILVISEKTPRILRQYLMKYGRMTLEQTNEFLKNKF